MKKNGYSRICAHLSPFVPHERNYIKSTEYLERIKSSSLTGKPKGKIQRKAQFYIMKVLMFHGVKGKKLTAKGKVLLPLVILLRLYIMEFSSAPFIIFIQWYKIPDIMKWNHFKCSCIKSFRNKLFSVAADTVTVTGTTE